MIVAHPVDWRTPHQEPIWYWCWRRSLKNGILQKELNHWRPWHIYCMMQFLTNVLLVSKSLHAPLQYDRHFDARPVSEDLLAFGPVCLRNSSFQRFMSPTVTAEPCDGPFCTVREGTTESTMFGTCAACKKCRYCSVECQVWGDA